MLICAIEILNIIIITLLCLSSYPLNITIHMHVGICYILNINIVSQWMSLFVSLELLPGLFTMKSSQVVIVAILFMALLIISEARKGKCRRRELRHTYCEQFCMTYHCWSEHDVERHLVKNTNVFSCLSTKFTLSSKISHFKKL